MKYSGIELIRKLSTAFGPSGCEDEVRELILEQIQGELEGLFARFCQALTAGQAVLLSELIIAASQHPEVGEEELLSLIRGGIEPRRV